MFILSIIIFGYCLGNLPFVGRRKSFAQFSRKKLNKEKEETRDREHAFLCCVHATAIFNCIFEAAVGAEERYEEKAGD